MLIAMEGVDGVGKSSLGRRLAEHLGWPFVEILRYSSDALELRRQILSGVPVRDRVDLHLKVFGKVSGNLVLDRYSPSFVAYGLLEGEDLSFLLKAIEPLPIPLVIYLTAPADVLVSRIESRGTPEPYKDHIGLLQTCYELVLPHFPHFRIDVNCSEDEAFKGVLSKVSKFLGLGR